MKRYTAIYWLEEETELDYPESLEVACAAFRITWSDLAKAMGRSSASITKMRKQVPKHTDRFELIALAFAKLGITDFSPRHFKEYRLLVEKAAQGLIPVVIRPDGAGKKPYQFSQVANPTKINPYLSGQDNKLPLGMANNTGLYSPNDNENTEEITGKHSVLNPRTENNSDISGDDTTRTLVSVVKGADWGVASSASAKIRPGR